MVCSVISSVKASSDFLTMLYRVLYCSSLDLLGSPKGYGIDIDGTILLAPTVAATGTRFAICTIGIPAFSISLTIVAPARVQVPQVDTNKTPSTLSSSRCSKISCPIREASACVVPVPTVE